jgi:hypothetical protein
MLLRNRNSAIPQLPFFLKSATSSPQLERFTSAIFGIFLAVEDIEDVKGTVAPDLLFLFFL